MSTQTSRWSEAASTAGASGSPGAGQTTPLPGAQVFAGFRPGDGGDFDRNALSIYTGLEADLTDSLSLGVAGLFLVGFGIRLGLNG